MAGEVRHVPEVGEDVLDPLGLPVERTVVAGRAPAPMSSRLQVIFHC